MIDKNKSSAITNIRANVVIDAFEAQLERIMRLFNLSLLTSIYPQSWKVSIVVPLSKVNFPQNASDLRPISLLPLPGKIMEHLISNRLKLFLQQNSTLTECQHGFRRNYSTITAITSLLHNVYVNLNNKMDTYMIFLDLKKAFDTVSHRILLNKLGNYGLTL